MTSAFVLDASIAFAWFNPGQATHASKALLKLVKSGTVAVVRPSGSLKFPMACSSHSVAS